ncbi:MAG: histidine kinase dimerization/phospho-acceptor domain-containing protein, partial [Trebonia sp.]
MSAKRLFRRTPPPRTLRGRLITGLVALLAVGCATVGIVTYFAVQRALSGEVNNQLQNATQLARTCWGAKTDNGQNVGNDGQGDGDGSPSSIDKSCTGLNEGTFIAHIVGGRREGAWIVGEGAVSVKQADQARLLAIRPSHLKPIGTSQVFPTTTDYLGVAQGTFLLTAIYDIDNDGSIYVTGLPLSDMHDFLSDVALVEVVVFGAVVVLAGVLGYFWVRFALRPLRRVTHTATTVAELPLESGEVSLPVGVPYTDPATETGQVGLAFNRMLGHVETALRRRAASESRLRRFAADASHELRTPLAAIRGYAELALRHP